MIHILEPHGDDALISCYPLLVDMPRNSIRVVTLGSSRPSDRLKEFFPSIESTIYADLYEVSIHTARAAYRADYQKWLRENDNSKDHSWMWQCQTTQKYAGELWKESYKELRRFLLPYLTQEVGPEDQVLAPIGLIHPYHILTSRMIVDLMMDHPSLLRSICFAAKPGQPVQFSSDKVWWYSDAPYNDAQWVEILEKSHPCTPQFSTQTTKLDPRDWEFKEKVFREVYPSEVKLFRFSYNSIIQNDYRIYR